MTDITTQGAEPDADPAIPAINAPTNATFQITDTKLYVPTVTLSAKNYKMFLEKLRTEFKRTNKWNKYRTEMTNQTQNNKLNYLIDPTFTKVNRLFVLSFENENDRISFSKYDVPNFQIKDFNVLIDGKDFFDIPIKMEKKHANKLSKWEETMITRQVIYWIMSTFQNICNLIAIDLSKQIELEHPDLKQQINFIGRTIRNERAKMFFIIEKSQETMFEFSQNAVMVV